MSTKSSIKESAKGAIGAAIGSSIYQLVHKSDESFHFYNPIFVGTVCFIVLLLWFSVTKKKNNVIE